MGSEMTGAKDSQCGHCCNIFAGEFCPRCESAHAKASKISVVGSKGRKSGASTLDMQEGNWEEWHGGLDFALKVYRND